MVTTALFMNRVEQGVQMSVYIIEFAVIRILEPAPCPYVQLTQVNEVHSRILITTRIPIERDSTKGSVAHLTETQLKLGDTFEACRDANTRRVHARRAPFRGCIGCYQY